MIRSSSNLNLKVDEAKKVLQNGFFKAMVSHCYPKNQNTSSKQKTDIYKRIYFQDKLMNLWKFGMALI